MMQLSPAAQQALDLAGEKMSVLEAEMAGLDREGRAKFLTERVAFRHWARRGTSTDDPDEVAIAAAISLLCIALVFEG